MPKKNERIKLEDSLPWKESIRLSSSKNTIEYTIYLGVIKLSYINEYVDILLSGKKEEKINPRNDEICMASFKTDIKGEYITNSFGLSTLPWAINQLEEGNINNDNWANAFQQLKDDLILDFEDKLVDIKSVEDIFNLQKKLLNDVNFKLNIPTNIYYRPEEKKISRKQNKGEDENNAEILNSFFIDDLEKIITAYSKQGEEYSAFSKYLRGCLNKPIEQPNNDLNVDTSILKETLYPNKYPDGKWPSPYPLSLMQQFAVNTINNKLEKTNKGDLLSVNGPPGTGKTTLLKDLVASVIVERAKNLKNFTEPDEALSKIGKLKKGGDFEPFIYSLDSPLCKTGMVVTSSNNGAVENISKELPQKDKIQPYEDDISYFEEAAQNCLNEKSWGLISAVLGNKDNRNKFISNLWFGEKDKKDLRKLLNGSNQTQNDWINAINEFNSALDAVNNEKKRINEHIKNYKKYCEYDYKYKQLNNKWLEIKNRQFEKSKEVNSIKTDYEKLKEKKENYLNELDQVKKTNPGFFTYIFNRRVKKTYKKAYHQILSNYSETRKDFEDKSRQLEIARNEHQELISQLESITIKLSDLEQRLNYYKKQVESARNELNGNFADEKFWASIESKETQTACPWYTEKLKELQIDVFIKALRLHETFILYSSTKSKAIETTLSAFFDYLKGNYEIKPSKQEIMAMWNMFFLIVPVISTTFASVKTMFSDLEEEDIPWLFIDEAGQALPQAATGAIWRSKRVVVVGDPFQIEPVQTIPDAITHNIRSKFSLDEKNVSNQLSVQKMADRVNPLGMYIENNWVGIPLRVHRRCIDPMFSISNDIAYGNKMILATSNGQSRLNFENAFWNISGTVEGRHWVREQGEKVKELILDEVNKSGDYPDLFVITPFTEIRIELYKLLYTTLLNELKNYKNPHDLDKGIQEWLKKSIGTIHTFQGKEADGVILCLGLDQKKKGAAQWAASKPNLLNVALTRAKNRFIAIGDKDIWLNVNYFKELKRLTINEENKKI
jgi:hypothetical protein